MISKQIKEKIDQFYDKLVDSIIYDIKTEFPNLTVLINAEPDYYNDEETSCRLKMSSLDKSKLSEDQLERYNNDFYEILYLGDEEFCEKNFSHLLNDNQFIIKFNTKYGENFIINQ